jgi:AcrR family transcriptional regulator
VTTNAERSAATRARLIGVARERFARDGYAATGTEAILAGAGVRRGAMYHHFADKAALFEAVCAQLSEEALPVVEAALVKAADPLDALVRGSIAWIGFVTRDDVRRILLVDAPTVLGWERWDALDRRLSSQALREGIDAALAGGAIAFDGSAELLAVMINGALNALALRVGAPAGGVPARQWQRAVRQLFETFAA